MISADTIKIKSKQNCIIGRNDEIHFSPVFDNSGRIEREQYKTKRIPFNLHVCLEHYQDNIIIEFSSKILGVRYPELINKNNIRDCLMEFNKLNIVTIDIDQFLSNASVVSMDITKDYTFDLSEEYISALNATTKEYRRYQNRQYKSGIRFSADVTSSKSKDSIVFYDKTREISNKKNEKFLKTLSETERKIVTDHFNHYKTRIEINLPSSKMIKKYLNLPSNELFAVLEAESNPIEYQFNRIFGSDTAGNSLVVDVENLIATEKRPMEARLICSYINEFNADMALMYQEARKIYASNSKALKVFMAKVERLVPYYNPNRRQELIDEIRGFIENA